MYTILTLANYAWQQIMPAEQQPKQEQQDVKGELITRANLYYIGGKTKEWSLTDDK